MLASFLMVGSPWFWFHFQLYVAINIVIGISYNNNMDIFKKIVNFS